MCHKFTFYYTLYTFHLSDLFVPEAKYILHPAGYLSSRCTITVIFLARGTCM